MSGNLDIASDREELARNNALSVRKPTGPSPTGRCLWCDEIVGDEQRWCSASSACTRPVCSLGLTRVRRPVHPAHSPSMC